MKCQSLRKRIPSPSDLELVDVGGARSRTSHSIRSLRPFCAVRANGANHIVPGRSESSASQYMVTTARCSQFVALTTPFSESTFMLRIPYCCRLACANHGRGTAQESSIFSPCTLCTLLYAIVSGPVSSFRAPPRRTQSDQGPGSAREYCRSSCIRPRLQDNYNDSLEDQRMG